VAAKTAQPIVILSFCEICSQIPFRTGDFFHRVIHVDNKQEKTGYSVIHGPYNIIFLSRILSLRRRKEARSAWAIFWRHIILG
jgi:hypothetical protein